MIAVVDGQARCGRSRGLGRKAPSRPCGSSIVRQVHSKQLIFRIRVLLEYGHHTRVGGEDRKGREQPLSAVRQAGQSLSQSATVPGNANRPSGSVNLGGLRSKSPNIDSVVQYRRPWLGPIHASRIGQNWTSFSTARPYRAAEWASSFSSRPNRGWEKPIL